MRRQQPEKGIYEAIVQVLRLHRVAVTRLAQPRASKQTPGVPDLFVMVPMRIGGLHPSLIGGLWVEVKGPKGKLSESQLAWHACAEASNVKVDVWRSVDDALAWLVKVRLRRDGDG